MDLATFNIKNYLEKLEYLVNIDSGSFTPEGTSKIASFFKEKYRELGWRVIEHNFHENIGPCLEIYSKESKDIDILLMGHMDTVFPPGTSAKRSFSIVGNKAYGPGVSDMKAGLLSMYFVLKGLFNSGKLKDNICVALNSDEEISSRYSKSWLESLAKKSKVALVMEPARENGALVYERKGIIRYDIDFFGVAAHAGREPEKGKSAIEEMAHWIKELHALQDTVKETTVNVGLASGGSATNVVADRAQISVDIRFKEMDEAQRIESKMSDLIKNPSIPGLKVDIKGGISRPPMNPSKKTKRLCRLIEQIGEKLDIKIKWASTGGGSDGNFAAALGVPTIDGLGPIGGGSHGVKEYVNIDSIKPRIILLKNIIETLQIRE